MSPAGPTTPAMPHHVEIAAAMGAPATNNPKREADATLELLDVRLSGRDWSAAVVVMVDH